MSLGPGGGMAVGESPAKYSFSANGTYSCANDFAVYTIAATPTATQANLVAFNNLYTGTLSSSCPFGPQTPPTTDFTKPTFMWSYAIGASASFLSPTLSLDGTKVSFIENGTPALFDVLTPTAGQGTDATHPVVMKSCGRFAGAAGLHQLRGGGMQEQRRQQQLIRVRRLHQRRGLRRGGQRNPLQNHGSIQRHAGCAILRHGQSWQAIDVGCLRPSQQSGIRV